MAEVPDFAALGLLEEIEGAAREARRERAGDEDFSWTEPGRKRIKGLKQPIPVWRCRPAQ